MTKPLPSQDLDAVLDATRDAFRDLSGERVFVTGGTGFFGVWLLESFLWANRRLQLKAEMHVLSRDPAAFLARQPHLAHAPELVFHAGSAADHAWQQPKGRFGFVIHAATESYLEPIDRLALFERDVQSTRRTLELAAMSGGARYLFTSSGAVYGKQPSELSHLAEESPLAPDCSDFRTGYAQAKRASEFLCALYAERHGLHASIARCFAFVGPHLPLHATLAVGNFLLDALAGGPIRVQGDGTPLRSYMYSSDLMSWLWTILFRGVAARPYNVGSDQAVDIASLARDVAAIVAPGCAIELAALPVAGAPVLRYVPSIARARSELGLSLRVDHRDGIARTAAWLRA